MQDFGSLFWLKPEQQAGRSWRQQADPFRIRVSTVQCPQKHHHRLTFMHLSGSSSCITSPHCNKRQTNIVVTFFYICLVTVYSLYTTVTSAFSQFSKQHCVIHQFKVDPAKFCQTTTLFHCLLLCQGDYVFSAICLFVCLFEACTDITFWSRSKSRHICTNYVSL